MTSDRSAPPEPRSLATPNGRREDPVQDQLSNVQRRELRSQRHRRCWGAANPACPRTGHRAALTCWQRRVQFLRGGPDDSRGGGSGSGGDATGTIGMEPNQFRSVLRDFPLKG